MFHLQFQEIGMASCKGLLLYTKNMLHSINTNYERAGWVGDCFSSVTVPLRMLWFSNTNLWLVFFCDFTVFWYVIVKSALVYCLVIAEGYKGSGVNIPMAFGKTLLESQEINQRLAAN